MESFKSPDGWYEGRPVASGSTPQNRSLARSSPPTNRIILANPIFQAFRKQCALAAVHPLFSGIKAGKVQIIVVYKIPWGVDSDQFWGQTEVANPLNLEATNATRSPLRRTDRYPNQSWRNFRLIGTQPFNLADHVAVAGRRREDVEAQRLGSGHRWAAVALFGAQAEGVRAEGAILPDHRHSRGGTGWLLDSSGAATEEIESYVVAAAPIATSRRRRRAKTDRIDGEALVRALLAYKRGEPRVCAMVRAPTSEDEDRRRLCRERKTLTVERVQHVNRIKGLLFSQGDSGYEPLRRNRRQRLDGLKTGDGRPLPPHLKGQIGRELDRLELLLGQIKAVEAERDALLTPATETEGMPAPQAMLIDLRGIGAEFAAVVWSEGLCRSFANRRQVAAYGGLAPTPWQSGSVAREQGVSKAGNPRLRTTMIQLAWLWLRHQPNSALAQWLQEEIKYLKRYTPSSETRSVSADPGGRTDGRHGFENPIHKM